MTYGWTKDEIDKLFLYEIKGLCEAIHELPPVDMVVFAMIKGDKKPIGHQIGSLGIPVKHGKVMRRPHGGSSGRIRGKANSRL